MSYVDGFVAAVPTANRACFQEMAARIAQVFIDHGALRVVENWGDDVPGGEQTWFARAVNARDDETVLFSWIEWPSKEARDKGNEAVMADPRTVQAPEEMNLMDPKRMIFGGFANLIDQRGA